MSFKDANLPMHNSAQKFEIEDGIKFWLKTRIQGLEHAVYTPAAIEGQYKILAMQELLEELDEAFEKHGEFPWETIRRESTPE